MNIINAKEALERIDQLIRHNATGSPKELASRLRITERTVYRIIRQLKEIGFPIYFNKAIRSYCYEYEGK
ncbi:MAG: HTH domain-containing protein, partial [Bacteroidales bacterium]|nr:HTH domain-containing protein [Bacteroidales bacterium]